MRELHIPPCYLFSRVRWQVKDEHSEEGYANAGDDEVHGVEEGLAAQGHVEGDVWKCIK